MKLLGSLASPYTRKVRVVAAEKKIDCELELVDVNPVENPVNTHNPLGKVPTLVLDAGLLVRYESQRKQLERSQAWTDKQLARMHRALELMAKDLEGRPWCHNDRYSLADIAVGCSLGWLDFRRPGEVDWHAKYPVLAQHHRKLMERAPFADTVPQAPQK